MGKVSRSRNNVKPGERHGHWEVLAAPFWYRSDGDSMSRRALCLCVCGKVKSVVVDQLVVGRSKSCGCRQCVRHGEGRKGARTKLYMVWMSMRRRCADLRDADYGGRGIRVCDEWAAFESFRSWAVQSGYREGLTIDRRDNDGDYEPSNCRWVTHKDNCRNSRQARPLTAFGETKCMQAWADDPRCQVGYHSLACRLYRGWPLERALTTPPRRWPSQEES